MFHITLGFTLVSRPSEDWVVPVLQLWVLGQFWGNWTQIPQIMSRDTHKVIQGFLRYISHWLMSYRGVKAIWWLSYNCFRLFGVLAHFQETGSQCPNFIILTYGALNLLSRMGSVSSFSQAVQETLLNNYLKTNFENSEIR